MNYFNRYVWLIDVISRYGHITKRDIDGLWSCSSLNERHEKEIPEGALPGSHTWPFLQIKFYWQNSRTLKTYAESYVEKSLTL